MTLEEVRSTVHEIQDYMEANDEDAAQSVRKRLYHDVLTAIAGGAPSAVRLAREALASESVRVGPSAIWPAQKIP